MKTILVIEDTPEMRENITEILQLAPYEVVAAANGKEGIEQARQTRPDLIICDIMMPELDGFGVLHILGKDPALADVPFIFLTARAELADFRFGMNLGADDYLTKPFDDLTLLNAVELRLHKSERGQVTSPANFAGLNTLTQTILSGKHAPHSLCESYPTTLYNRKHQLFTAGSWPVVLYFINQGKIRVFKTDAIGNEYITGILGPGAFVGYLALFEEKIYSVTAEVLEDAQVCAIPKADFLALIYHHQEVATRFTQILAGDVTEHQERLLKLASQSVRQRVAEALLMFQRKFYSRSGEPAGGPAEGSDSPAINASLPMNLARETLAHLVGASTETVIRILGDLRAEGLISLSDRQTTLLDIDKLARLKH